MSMHVPDNPKVALFIETVGPVVGDAKGLGWTPGVFPALKTLSDGGRYELHLLADGREGSVANNLRNILQEQGVVIESIVMDVDGVPGIDRALSCVIRSKDEKDPGGLRSIAFTDWPSLVRQLAGEDVPESRRARIERSTKETCITMQLDLDGSGKADIETGLPFFDHMLSQVARHGRLDLSIRCAGDLEVDEHHSVEDVAIVLGQAFASALGDKRGISRYGFELLPMDECLAQVAIDFSGRAWFAWDVAFTRELVGTFPTELFSHFFKSFSDEAKCNLHMHVSSGNAHHQAEALFKAFGRAIKRAVFRYPGVDDLPSTKGVL